MPDEATIREHIRRGMAEYPQMVQDHQTGRDRDGAIAALIGVLTRGDGWRFHTERRPGGERS